MPNTPAQLGRGMTVWYATPETTDDQRAQAKALLSALGSEIEVDDEKLVAMATAVSGTGPTYVFLVHGGAHRLRRPPRVPAPRRARPRRRDAGGQHASSPSSPAITRPCSGTWSPRPAGRVPRPSTSSNPGACGPCSPRRSGPRIAGPWSSATSSRPPSTLPRNAATGDGRPTRRADRRQASPARAGSWRSSPTRTTRPSAPAGRWRLPLQPASRRGSSARRTATRAAWRAPARSTRSFGAVSCAAR